LLMQKKCRRDPVLHKNSSQFQWDCSCFLNSAAPGPFNNAITLIA
jgi:hypothetical protein